MKTTIIGGFAILNLAGVASATVVVDSDWTVNTAITAGSPVGITTSETFQNLSSSPITSVSVDLDISGGFNGDLYGYLTYQGANGTVISEMLLDYVGTTTANPFGSSGSGMDVTLSDAGTANGSIHNAAGTATGTWLADSTSTLDSTFGGLSANGTWTLYLADMSEGSGTSTLISWGLDINASSVPEPVDYGWAAGTLVLAGSIWRLRRKTAIA